MPDEGDDRLQTFHEYLRQYNVLKDVFGCRDASPVIQRAELLNGARSNGEMKVHSSEDRMLTELAATQVIIKSSIIDQAVWSWWTMESCPDLADRKIDLHPTRENSAWQLNVRCWERYRNARPELEVWAPVGAGQSIVEAVYNAATAEQFGKEGEACPGEDPQKK